MRFSENIPEKPPRNAYSISKTQTSSCADQLRIHDRILKKVSHRRGYVDRVFFDNGNVKARRDRASSYSTESIGLPDPKGHITAYNCTRGLGSNPPMAICCQPEDTVFYAVYRGRFTNDPTAGCYSFVSDFSRLMNFHWIAQLQLADQDGDRPINAYSESNDPLFSCINPKIDLTYIGDCIRRYDSTDHCQKEME